MSEMNISLKGPEDALEFVRRVEKYPYTMDLCCGSIVVDAKSILGILYLGFDHVVHLKVHAGECGELRKDLKNFEKSLEKQEIRIFSFLQKCDKLSTTSLQRQK